MGASSARAVALADIDEKIRQIEHMLEQCKDLLEHVSPGTESQDTAVSLLLEMATVHLESVEVFKSMLEKAKEG